MNLKKQKNIQTNHSKNWRVSSFVKSSAFYIKASINSVINIAV